MGEQYFYHFPRDRALSSEDRYASMNAVQRFCSILKAREIQGNNGKGYFHTTHQLPKSVSLSIADLGELEQFIQHRSHYGIALLRTSQEQARPVLYLTKQEIQRTTFTEEQKPFIDLKRTQRLPHEGIDGTYYEYSRYDYTWEQEWRILTEKLIIKDIAFATVKGKEDVKAINEKLGIEAIDLYQFETNKQLILQEARKKGITKITGFDQALDKGWKQHKKEGQFVLTEVVQELLEKLHERMKHQ